MADVKVLKTDDCAVAFGGAMKLVRDSLGVESFGMQVIDMPANYENYPEHDHTHDNQEEVFLVMRGGGEIEIEGKRFPLDDNHVARVGPETKRKIWPGPEGIRLVVLGGTPGAAYEAPDLTKLGEPDPMAAS